MKAAAGLTLLFLLASGCFGAPPDARPVQPAAVAVDPTAIHVAGFAVHNYTVASWDGTKLSSLAYVPFVNATDTAPAVWPMVVFLHGWGGSKEAFAGTTGPAPTGTDRLAAFAQAGFIAVAYDARGFGASEGMTSVAGPAEQSDLASVIHDAEARFGNVGLVGVTGQSYGGGQSLLAWARNPDVTTAVPQYGWDDLAAGLIPGNVPKIEWGQALYLYGLAHGGRYEPFIHDWYQQLYLRDHLDAVRQQMDDRSVEREMGAVHKPLFACQGMQETLFPQIDSLWRGAGGFTRAYVYTGGHGGSDEGCWQRTLEWFRFFLAGFDTRVDSWPAVETVDASGVGGTISYMAPPAAEPATFHLRGGDLDPGPASAMTFSIRQTLVGNPLGDPSAIGDRGGMPNQWLPDGLRANPSEVAFGTDIAAPAVLVGAPQLVLHKTGGNVPFQVAAILTHVRADGQSQVLSHAAAAALKEGDVADGNLTLQFHWTRAELDAGDRLVLHVTSNDPSWWMPLLADYDVTFDGHSWIELPLALA